MIGSLGGMEIAIIALVVILVFGVGKFSSLGKDLGSSIKEFRRAVKEDDADDKGTNVQQASAPPPQQQYTPPSAQPQPPQQGDQKSNLF